MKDDMIDKDRDELKEFNENPFDPERRRPEDIVRLFYTHNVPVIPVISKRGMLIGIIRKRDVISELSDIERVEKLKIDKFITKLAVKMTFDELLPHGKIREFVVINIFGDVQCKWPRAKLFAACENNNLLPVNEIEENKDEQIMEWIIYLILEFIPRPLYAVNEKGSTIFYNSHFEDICLKKLKKSEVDTGFIEKSFNDESKNDLISGNNDEELYFFNKDLEMYYEKVPMMSKDKKVGYLIYSDMNRSLSSPSMINGVDVRGMPLNKMLASIERQIIADAINQNRDMNAAARALKISRQALISKAKRFGISLKS